MYVLSSFFYETKMNRLSQILFSIIFFLDLRGKFSAIHREYSPNPRKFYAFCTSVTDTATTAGIIASGTSFPFFFKKKKKTGFTQVAQLLFFFFEQYATWWFANISSNLNWCNLQKIAKVLFLYITIVVSSKLTYFPGPTTLCLPLPLAYYRTHM